MAKITRRPKAIVLVFCATCGTSGGIDGAVMQVQYGEDGEGRKPRESCRATAAEHQRENPGHRIEVITYQRSWAIVGPFGRAERARHSAAGRPCARN